MELRSSKILDVRFSEVDSMNVVWHGSYALYFEDLRELFGREYGLEYMSFFDHGYYAPLVDLQFHYRRPIRYGMHPRADIVYRPTESAKIVFDYELRHPDTGVLMASGTSVQVFMDTAYNLVWASPAFYEEWKGRWQVFEK